VRDYILQKYGGQEDRRYFIWCREERNEDGSLLNRDQLAKKILQQLGIDGKKVKAEDILGGAYDMRIFGAVFSVGENSFHRTGPVQFGWAHSMHPAQTRYVQGTTIMPSGSEREQGTIWTMYFLPFGIFLMPGVINAKIAEKAGVSDEDVEVLLEALWRGTLMRQARGRGFQQPELLVHVEYSDPLFRIGFLEDSLVLEPGREVWLGPKAPTSIAEVTIDVSGLNALLSRFKDKIARIRWWKGEELKLKGSLPGEQIKVW
jgi:CRISPR-associated protein Csh2